MRTFQSVQANVICNGDRRPRILSPGDCNEEHVLVAGHIGAAPVQTHLGQVPNSWTWTKCSLLAMPTRAELTHGALLALVFAAILFNPLLYSTGLLLWPPLLASTADVSIAGNTSALLCSLEALLPVAVTAS